MIDNQALARLLGYAGLLPFIICVALIWFAPTELGAIAAGALLYYSAVILSFLGGILWGAAISSQQRRFGLLWFSIVPPLIAWITLLVPMGIAIWLLCAAFLLQGLWDRRCVQLAIFPQWYGRLRLSLTMLVVVLLLLAWPRLGSGL
jgi:hypothetical protein